MSPAQRIAWFVLVALGGRVFGQPAANGDQTPKAPEPISVTLCEVAAHPDRFDGKLVRFRASFVSDGMDHSILVQRGCKRGIVPYAAPDNKQRPDVDAFDRAIETGAPGTADKKVVAVFTGRFVWKPPSKRIIELEGVADLQVTSIKRKGSKPEKP